MAFASEVDAADSRRAVAALMGLATREGFLSATTDHFDLTPAVANQAPLMPNRHGAMIAAPDLILLNLALELVINVEVETRSFAKHYPGRTFADVAKLAPHCEVQTAGSVYARTIKGSDYDQPASWGQRDIDDLLAAFRAGKINHAQTTNAVLMILKQSDLWTLDQLWQRMRGGRA
jgi:hypothetical protein